MTTLPHSIKTQTTDKSPLKLTQLFKERDELISLHLESDSIGEVMRNGKIAYYAVINGLPHYAKTRYEIAVQLVNFSLA